MGSSAKDISLESSNLRPQESFETSIPVGKGDGESNTSELPFPLLSESPHLLLHMPRRTASGQFG
jgi:hypothetical protein